MFGDVPNLGLVSARIYEVARGNPRECTDLAQHLCDQGIVRYEAGSWELPSGLDAAQLPSSAEQAFCERVAGLSPLARLLAQAQALASHDAFSRQEYAALAADSDPQQVDQAITELVSAQVLVSDGRVYTLSHGNRAAAIAAQLAPDELEQRHRVLAELYAQTEATALSAVYHMPAAGQFERALDRLSAIIAEVDKRGGVIAMPPASRLKLVPVFEHALAASLRLGRRAREAQQLRGWLTAFSVVADDSVYWSAAPTWREQLEHDSGLTLYRQLSHVAGPGERLRRALEQAAARYQATPEPERVFPPDAAIKSLVHYVVISIAIGARTLDARLIASLPPLLEPFAPLSPLIDAMWQNAICTYEANCAGKQERARLRAVELHARVSLLPDGGELRTLAPIRNALAYCAGAIEAMLGLKSACGCCRSCRSSSRR